MTPSSQRITGSIFFNLIIYYRNCKLYMVEYLHSHRSSTFPGIVENFSHMFHTKTSRHVCFDISISSYQGRSIIFATGRFGTTGVSSQCIHYVFVFNSVTGSHNHIFNRLCFTREIMTRSIVKQIAFVIGFDTKK